MPYRGQGAGKGGHTDLVKNPDVSSFLGDCDYMTEPSEEEAKKIASTFLQAPTTDSLPVKVVASDASPYSEPISGLFPSTQIGYVKTSLVLIDLEDYEGLTPKGSRFVDPFKAAALHRNADAISFTLPGSNVVYGNEKTVKDGFRKAVWEQLSDKRTCFTKDGDFNVVGTLLALDENEVFLKKCPACDDTQSDLGFTFSKEKQIKNCENCDTSVYLTDSLRIHEQISDYGDNGAAITRFMNVAEHLIIATLVRMLSHYQPEALSRMAFVLDGPLAIFGQPAKIHARLMKFYHKTSKSLAEKGLKPPVIIGLQKTGLVMEHAKALLRRLPDKDGKFKGIFRVVDDEYRSKYISGVAEKSENFGHETYYGQDFIFRTESGGIFAVGIPYPFDGYCNSNCVNACR